MDETPTRSTTNLESNSFSLDISATLVPAAIVSMAIVPAAGLVSII